MILDNVFIHKLAQHSQLDPGVVSALRSLTLSVRNLLPNEDFIRQGDRPRSCAIVVEGMLARYHVLESGHRQYLSLHLPGEWPDAQGLFLERMHHSICAIGSAVVCAIPHDELVKVFRNRPTTAFAVRRETLIDASVFREAITNNSSRGPVARLAHLFCEVYFKAKRIGLIREGIGSLPLNQAQIGEMLGMSLITVNRSLQRLRRSSAADFKAGKLFDDGVRERLGKYI